MVEAKQFFFLSALPAGRFRLFLPDTSARATNLLLRFLQYREPLGGRFLFVWQETTIFAPLPAEWVGESFEGEAPAVRHGHPDEIPCRRNRTYFPLPGN